MNERLRSVLADVFGVRPERISVQDTHETIPGWDSLHHLQMIMALEQEFGVQLDTEQIADIRSVADIVRLLDGAQQDQAGA